MSRREEGPIIPPVEEPGTARHRVQDLAARLARAAALGGAALGLASVESCWPMVCDPLPPPITCTNPTHDELLAAMNPWARWEAADAGQLAVRLTVGFYSQNTVTFSSNLTLTGATQLEATISPSHLDVTLLPDTGVSQVTALVRFDCSNVSNSMTLSLDVSGMPGAGTNVPVTLVTP